LCQSFKCVPASGCVFQPIPKPQDTPCNKYTCDPKTGIVITPTGICTPTPVCTVATQAADCSDNNACTDDTCVLADPTEPRTAKCVSTPQAANTCDSTDKCVTTSCDPATGCVSKPVPVPDSTTCDTYSCAPASGITSTPTGVCSDNIICTVATQTTDCNDKNGCTDDTCVLTVPTEPKIAKCVFTHKAADACNEADKRFT
jgi:hypothetical protein